MTDEQFYLLAVRKICAVVHVLGPKRLDANVESPTDILLAMSLADRLSRACNDFQLGRNKEAAIHLLATHADGLAGMARIWTQDLGQEISSDVIQHQLVIRNFQGVYADSDSSPEIASG